MKPKENLETREKMAEMHDDVLKRIESAYKQKNHIELCWLCYACFESRVNRILDKICSGCNKPIRTDNRKIGIGTKLDCLARLTKCEYAPLKQENINLMHTVKGWCVERNKLIHNLIDLNTYQGIDKKFENLAIRGYRLVKDMYKTGSTVREYYYQADDIPPFDSSNIQRCGLKYKCIQEK